MIPKLSDELIGKLPRQAQDSYYSCENENDGWKAILAGWELDLELGVYVARDQVITVTEPLKFMWQLADLTEVPDALFEQMAGVLEAGGHGSGHFGHKGRKGQIGGSHPTTGNGGAGGSWVDAGKHKLHFSKSDIAALKSGKLTPETTALKKPLGPKAFTRYTRVADLSAKPGSPAAEANKRVGALEGMAHAYRIAASDPKLKKWQRNALLVTADRCYQAADKFAATRDAKVSK